MRSFYGVGAAGYSDQVWLGVDAATPMFQEDLGWYGSDTWTADRNSKLRIECPLDVTEFWVQ